MIHTAGEKVIWCPLLPYNPAPPLKLSASKSIPVEYVHLKPLLSFLSKHDTELFPKHLPFCTPKLTTFSSSTQRENYFEVHTYIVTVETWHKEKEHSNQVTEAL